MKLRKVLVVCSLLLTLFVVTGCVFSPKKAATVDKFKSVAEKNNLTIIDAREQMKDYDFVQEALIAKSAEGWQIEFYVLSTNEDAKSMYDTNRRIFEDSKSGTVKENFLTIKEYSLYNLKSGGYYMHLSKVDNTLLYMKVNEKYENNVNRFIKELGY